MEVIWDSKNNPESIQYHQNIDNVYRGQINTAEGMNLMDLGAQVTTNQPIAQHHQISPCLTCANYKYSTNQQFTLINNTDLNGINLSSLAVDGDLDEDQLLEYLAGYDPTEVFYIQNNTFS